MKRTAKQIKDLNREYDKIVKKVIEEEFFLDFMSPENKVRIHDLVQTEHSLNLNINLKE